MTVCPPRRAGAGGFTLLEILVALAILAVALVSLLGLHARNVRLTAESQDLTLAGMLASHRAAMARAAPGAFPEPGTTEGGFSEEDEFVPDLDEAFGGTLSGRFAWTQEVVSLPPPFANLRRVTIGILALDRESDQPLVELDFLVRRPG